MFDAEAEVKSLKEEIVHLQSELFKLQKNQSSRVGLQGGRGETGATGASGRDAVLRVVTDAKENVICVFDEAGNEKATLVSIPGKNGRDGVDGKSITGPAGKDGRNAPSLDEVVRGVLQAVKAKL
jgi:hypothetical protein